MKKVYSYTDFLQQTVKEDKSFLLLYKSSSELSMRTFQNLETAIASHPESLVYSADVEEVNDIHSKYAISSLPSLLIFEEHNFVSVMKGCLESSFYSALIQNALYQAQAKDEAKTVKRVTVYSTPTCSWCNSLKSWLRKNNISFTDRDVSRDDGAFLELVSRSGQQGVPQTEINGQIVVGFDQPRLKQLLEIQ